MTTKNDSPSMMDSYLSGNDVVIDVFRLERISSLVVDQYGLPPVRAMMDVVGVHSEGMAEGDSAEFSAVLPDGPITVTVSRS